MNIYKFCTNYYSITLFFGPWGTLKIILFSQNSTVCLVMRCAMDECWLFSCKSVFDSNFFLLHLLCHSHPHFITSKHLYVFVIPEIGLLPASVSKIHGKQFLVAFFHITMCPERQTKLNSYLFTLTFIFAFVFVIPELELLHVFVSKNHGKCLLGRPNLRWAFLVAWGTWR